MCDTFSRDPSQTARIIAAVRSGVVRAPFVESTGRALFALTALLIAGLSAQHARAAGYTTPAATFQRQVVEMLADPNRLAVYASTESNTVISIDSKTLAMSEVAVGANPAGLDLSPDGSKLYVANSGSTTTGISVIDLSTFAVSYSISTPFKVTSLAADANGNLYIIGAGDSITEIDAATGVVKATVSSQKVPVYLGKLRASLDRRRLFYGNFVLSPSSLYALDISGSTPTLLQRTSSAWVGSNGEDLVMSPTGNALVFPSGGGNGSGPGYSIVLIPTDDVNGAWGQFDVGAYPFNGAFSPDGAIFYTAPSSQHQVQIWSAVTFNQIDTFSTPDLGELAVDSSGKFLFAATADSPSALNVYSTSSARPKITSLSEVSVIKDTPVNVSLTSNASVTWTQFGLPSGLSLDFRTGAITGAVPFTGTVTATVTATDTANHAVSSDLVFDILPAGAPLPAATFPRRIVNLLADPARPIVYATTKSNTVIAINIGTLSMSEVEVGSNPVGLDLSPDGSKLYVSNRGATTTGVSVIDLPSFAVAYTLATPFRVDSLAADAKGNLYIRGDGNSPVTEIDAATGATKATVNAGSNFVYSGKLRASLDRRTLFYGDFDLSPSSLYAIDISGSMPVLLQSNGANGLGSDGVDLIISPAGDALVFPNRTGQGSGIYLIPTDNITGVIGEFKTGSGNNGAFSPDGSIFYTAPYDQNVIESWSTRTFAQIASFPTPAVKALAVDSYGRYFFAATGEAFFDEPSVLNVYSTGAGVNPTITSASSVSVNENGALNFTLTSSVAKVTWAQTNLPAGFSLDAKTGVIAGSTGTPGPYLVTVTATDTTGYSVFGTLVINVLASVTVQVNGQGSIAGGSTGVSWMPVGAPYALTATPDPGNAFVGWTGDHISAGATIAGSINGDTVFTANFSGTATLTVSETGPGSVMEPYDGSTTQVVGRNVSLTAMPAPGAVFLGWAGDIVSQQNPLLFKFTGPTNVTATFRPLAEVTGKYVFPTASSSSGALNALSVGITSGSRITGSLNLGGKSYHINSPFPVAIGFTGTFRDASGVAYVLHLALSNSSGPPQLTATLKSAAGQTTFAGDRLAQVARGLAASQAGKYTFLLPPPSGETTVGYGYGVATVAKSGAVRLVGVLGDGAPFTAGGQTTESGGVLVRIPLYANKGGLGGFLQFEDMPEISDFDGNVVWSRPAKVGNKLKANAVQSTILAVGSALNAPAAADLFNLTSGRVIFSGGGLSGPSPTRVTLASGNQIVPGTPDPNAAKFKLNAKTGAFTGVFTPPGMTKSSAFSGVVFLKNQTAAGCFKSPTGAGHGAFEFGQ